MNSYPCINCLQETEDTLKAGSWKSLPKPIYYWYEMCSAEALELREYLETNKPASVLEIGCGTGRIIKELLKSPNVNEICAVEKNKAMFDHVRKIFDDFKNVDIVRDDAEKFLEKTEKKFDLCIVMMNTLGNIDNIKLIKKILSKSSKLLFTLYDAEHYKLREEIYRSRGHKKFTSKGTSYVFSDDWMKGLISNSYSRGEIIDLCEQVDNVEFKIKKIAKLLFLVELTAK